MANSLNTTFPVTERWTKYQISIIAISTVWLLLVLVLDHYGYLASSLGSKLHTVFYLLPILLAALAAIEQAIMFLAGTTVIGVMMIFATSPRLQQEGVVAFSLDDRSVSLLSVLITSFFCVLLLRKQRLQYQSLYITASLDSLTKTYNRGHLEKELQLECARARRYKHKLTMVMFDIDHFKALNDKYGHNAGDEVLRFVSRTAKNALRNIDTIGRFGGEEFLILLPYTNIAAAEFVAERIRNQIADRTVKFNHLEMKSTISLGIAEYEEKFDLVQFIEKADQAMYKAKNKGRNRTIIAEKSQMKATQSDSAPHVERRKTATAKKTVITRKTATTKKTDSAD